MLGDTDRNAVERTAVAVDLFGEVARCDDLAALDRQRARTQLYTRSTRNRAAVDGQLTVLRMIDRRAFACDRTAVNNDTCAVLGAIPLNGCISSVSGQVCLGRQVGIEYIACISRTCFPDIDRICIL